MMRFLVYWTHVHMVFDFVVEVIWIVRVLRTDPAVSKLAWLDSMKFLASLEVVVMRMWVQM